jgi:hypothetical protein
MDKYELKRWESLRQRGRASFVWRVGLLGYGLPMMLGAVIVRLIMQWWTSQPNQSFILNIAIAFALWPLAGLLFGFAVWHLNERSYKRQALAAQSASAQ